jgi:hypothetical protein
LKAERGFTTEDTESTEKKGKKKERRKEKRNCGLSKDGGLKPALQMDYGL